MICMSRFVPWEQNHAKQSHIRPATQARAPVPACRLRPRSRMVRGHKTAQLEDSLLRKMKPPLRRLLVQTPLEYRSKKAGIVKRRRGCQRRGRVWQ